MAARQIALCRKARVNKPITMMMMNLENLLVRNRNAESLDSWGSPVLHRDIQEKTLKIFLSETEMPRALIFGVQHCLLVLYLDYSNYAPSVKIGRCHVPPILHRDIKYIFKMFLSETEWPRAQIFGVNYCLMVLYEGCSINALHVKGSPVLQRDIKK